MNHEKKDRTFHLFAFFIFSRANIVNTTAVPVNLNVIVVTVRLATDTDSLNYLYSHSTRLNPVRQN